MAGSLSLLPSDRITLQNACHRMRVLIKSCPDAEVETMRIPFNILGALEQIALNAPENSGRLRTLQLELRHAITEFNAAVGATPSTIDIQTTLRDILDVLQKPRGIVAFPLA